MSMKQRLNTWRLFTVVVALVAGFVGFALGIVATNNVAYWDAWNTGYSAAHQEMGVRQ